MPVWLTYSLLLVCAGALGCGLYLSSDRGRDRFDRFARYATVLQIAALVGAYLVVRPGAGDDGEAAIAAASAADKPIFIDMYSNF